MRYYAQYDPKGSFTGLIKSVTPVENTKEISQEEYEKILAEIREKASYVDSVYNGNLRIDQVPEKWRDEIQNRVDQQKVDDALASQAAKTN